MVSMPITVNAGESSLIVLRSVIKASCPSRAWTQNSEPKNSGDQVVLGQLRGWAERAGQARAQPQAAVAMPSLVLCEGHWPFWGSAEEEGSQDKGEEEPLTGLQVAGPGHAFRAHACSSQGEQVRGQMASSHKL